MNIIGLQIVLILIGLIVWGSMAFVLFHFIAKFW